MEIILVVGVVVLALVALVGTLASLRRDDTEDATGQLVGEAVKRDRGAISLQSDPAASDVTGSQIEKAAVSQRSGKLVAPGAKAPVAYVPPDPETLGVARRQFLNRSIIGTFAFGLTGFGAACIGFLWPQGSSGFGSRITVGRIPDIKDSIKAGGGFFYVPEGRMWITEYPSFAMEKATKEYAFYDQVSPGLKAGVVALFQTCPHLGCRVPECGTSQWFECPCHGSQYNRVGEKKGGPAPRGMDRFPMEVNAANELVVDTGIVIKGPPIGTNTTGQEAEGPNCISGGGGHG